jgi:hypothetical protein
MIWENVDTPMKTTTRFNVKGKMEAAIRYGGLYGKEGSNINP